MPSVTHLPRERNTPGHGISVVHDALEPHSATFAMMMRQRRSLWVGLLRQMMYRQICWPAPGGWRSRYRHPEMHAAPRACCAADDDAGVQASPRRCLTQLRGAVP